jgi:D-alanyl-lipoteichoic acid acyltransferase DltB (MBOAT superfamily)
MSDFFDYLLRVFSFDDSNPLLFTQFQFWAFFAFIFAGFAYFKRRKILRNSYLFFISLFFYYKTSGLFVGLLVLVTCSDFLIAKRIAIAKTQLTKKLFLLLSIIIDLSILCYFKYAYFFADVLNTAFGLDIEVTNIAASGFNNLFGTSFNVDSIILPVGISFYTFQVISYTFDVYKGLIKPVTNIFDFGFYVTFFPQLVAGPIVKASDFIPQLYKKYSLSKRQFGIAVFWILNGLLKKIILSDYLALNFIDRVFDNPLLASGFENVAALFLYSLQVYADFSGYTDIAIGLSLLMGFHLPKNFDSPYKAQNCSNFWKRWHISLSRWLQTYLYIPLGGNRNITFGTYFWIITITLIALILSGSIWVALIVLSIAGLVIFTAVKFPAKRKSIVANLNSMVTMLLGGLWHGASCNFMIWGGLNGVGMVVYKFWRDWSLLDRLIVAGGIFVILFVLTLLYPTPLCSLLLVFMLLVLLGAAIRYLYKKSKCQSDFSWLERSWAIFITFVFISFTRLFFRSGSDLDPAVANEKAWKTASDMVTQIGSSWNVNIFDVISEYSVVFALFVIGMIIHWLPDRLKRRYRMAFAQLPIYAIGAIVVIAVFVAYQFMSSEMKPFIYFQF